jgi:anthranilate/para-aminobenzoate synthase component I
MSPLELLARMPVDRPVFMLHSGGRSDAFARASIVASPVVTYRFSGRSELDVWPGSEADTTVRELVRAANGFTHDPLRDVDALLAITRERSDRNDASSGDRNGNGGWIGAFAYELGALIEPAAKAQRAEPRHLDWPLVEVGWCPSALCYDNESHEWSHRGAGDALSIAERRVVEHWSAGPLTPSVPRQAHIGNVARTVEHILAGDIFQANITQQFTAAFQGSTRALAREALEASGAWYGAMLEFAGGRTIVSMSPELFLAVDAKTRSVTTRPIKGTRPRHMDPSELERSEKDKAELAMIVDLMRNDLGRVSEIGSIRVTNPRKIETHGLVHQGVGEVVGTLRPDVSLGDLLRATFPPGSVTGAPKIRAMQIIDELEAQPRGPYCGAIGMIGDNGDITLNVAIRTITLQGERPGNRFDALDGTLSYGAGGGIVADSEPNAEYNEMIDKTAMLRTILAGHATLRV